MKNIVLFGGNFDPVHNGHLNMSVIASKKLDADVIFIPAKISIWKNKASPIDDRVAVLKEAIKGGVDKNLQSRFSISLYEASLDTDFNYTVDTVRHFKQIYPNDNLFLLIGADQVNRFHDWKESNELAKMATIVFFMRPNIILDKNNVEKYHMLALQGEMVEESSTDIRELKSLKTPIEAVEEIIKRNMYFTPKLKKYLSDYRLNHGLSVAKTAYKIAKSNNVEHIDKIILASLLHDTAKELDMNRTIDIMKNYYPEYISYHKAMYHQFVGEYIVKHDFGIDDQEILDAIKFHTTGKTNMSITGIIVYASDKIEPTRGLYSYALIEAMCKDLMSGFSTVLIDNRRYYIEHNIDYKNDLTLGCMNQYIIE